MRAIVVSYPSSIEVRPDRTWQTVEDHLAKLSGRPNDSGHRCRLTRISRKDGGCNYTAPGLYEVTLTHETMGDQDYRIQLADSSPRHWPAVEPHELGG